MTRTERIACLALAFVLAACSGGSSGGDDTDSDSDSDTDTGVSWADLPNHRIVFLSNAEAPATTTTELHLLEHPGTVTQLLDDATPHGNPSISPDGKTVAFHRFLVPDDFSSAELFLLDIETRVETRLTDNDFSSVAPKWSPDGSHLVFAAWASGQGPAASANIHLLDLNDEAVLRLTEDDLAQHQNNDPAFCGPERLVFKSTRFTGELAKEEIFTMNTDGTDLRRLSDQAQGYRSDHDPRCSADGKVVYFYRFEASRPWTDMVSPDFDPASIWSEIYPTNIWLTGVDDEPGSEVRITDCAHACRYPIPSANGFLAWLHTDFLLDAENRLVGSSTRFVLASADGSGAVDLVDEDCYADHASTLEYFDW
jgi:Tol biopolymer transport system component